MRPVLLAACMLALASYPARAEDDPEPPGGMTRELKALQGTWELHSLRAAGIDAVPAIDKLKFTLTVTRSKVRVKQGGDAEKESTIKIDPKKTPMHIDMTEKGGKTSLGIYRVEKGEWHIAVLIQPDQNERPKSFDQGKIVVMILKKKATP